MSCSPFDLKEYFLQELPSPQRLQVEAHVKTCPPCREELERLQLTEAALFSLRDEEIPQRIAFVSDQIFEPSPVRRWLSGFWGSTARLGFASAAMLSASLILFCCNSTGSRAGSHGGPYHGRRVSFPAGESSSRSSRPSPRPSPKWKPGRPKRTSNWWPNSSAGATRRCEVVRWMDGELDADRKRAQVQRMARRHAMPSRRDSGDAK